MYRITKYSEHKQCINQPVSSAGEGWTEVRELILGADLYGQDRLLKNKSHALSDGFP